MRNIVIFLPQISQQCGLLEEGDPSYEPRPLLVESGEFLEKQGVAPLCLGGILRGGDTTKPFRLARIKAPYEITI
jgi:hypothetical protein